MNPQVDWVDNPPPYAHGSETSRKAAESLTNTETLRQAVLHAIRLRNGLGATDQELQELLRLPPNVETPRRWELVKLGHVKDSGQRRKTRSGRSAVVWTTTKPAPHS
jgi:hypothetical protein